MDESDMVEVEMCSMEKGEYPAVLQSGGLGPCIAIGFYDPKTRSGYMMHEPGMRHTDLSGRIQQIKRDYGGLSKLEVFVTGNSLSSNDDDTQREYVRSDRLFVEKIIKKYFRKSQVQIQWLPDNHIGELYLDTTTGQFSLEMVSDLEMKIANQAREDEALYQMGKMRVKGLR